MYQKQVETLTLEQIPLNFKDMEGNEISKDNPIIDFGYPIENIGCPFLPDYGIKGFFQVIDHNSKNEFIIFPQGPHILFITGVNKGKTEQFKINNPLSISYWEDTHIGYLFQIDKEN